MDILVLYNMVYFLGGAWLFFMHFSKYNFCGGKNVRNFVDY